MSHAPAHDAGAVAAAVTPAAGSDFYYASHYFPPAARHRLRVIEALRREIARIPATVTDRGVAHVKLAWWREELSAAADDTARHPLTTAARPLLTAEPALRESFVRFVENVDARLAGRSFDTREDVIADIAAVQGELFGTLGSAADDTALLRLACLVELAYDLRELRRHRAEPTLHLADRALAAHRLSRDRVREAHASHEIAALMRDEITAVRDAIDATLAGIPRRRRRRQRLFTTLARIQRRALELTLEDGCCVLERRIELTPVHKLLIAWRTRQLG